MQSDKFQPMTIVQRLDQLREDADKSDHPVHYTEEEWVLIIKGYKLAMAQARVEVMAMATAKDRFSNE